ncbi:SRPBCC domain-containing protein [Listeria seeligeri]|uniref:SRPBCC domain-containing protein n=1 Tax=Listeria seeligeri TaxID=1640 RepID=UPI0016269AA9|nr:SRPBCC domain-containing protein [Listeria seeligeri]MBC1734643.1 ATPase [Listeria seeligeri]MBF2365780.1 SRPBCC domain-containing protein [Listeria seeligeri]MBF2539389.1 SRPBCC domain-containing protein [Listeria seeligeri]MBF2586148.1 SRPBCC domain-containing protein [Listeria seeligeri]MBF2605642.1 SRPBCC domain-containing protein [Listeria seeligeri]
MKEIIKKQADGTAEVRLEFEVNNSAARVFELLTTNEGLAQWFNELEVGELGNGGYLLFVMMPEERISMPILAWEPNQKLGFEWDKDSVTFELTEVAENKTFISFTEQLHAISEHSPRDISGWYICLKRLQAVAAGSQYDFDKTEFETLFLKYQKALNNEK